MGILQNHGSGGGASEVSPLLQSCTQKETKLYGDKEEHHHGSRHSHSSSHDHHNHNHGHEPSERYHDHSEHYHGNNTNSKADNEVLRRLKTATVLCCTFMLVEVIGGLLAGSLAVLSDAAHLCADLASFAVAIVAAYLAARPSTDRHTYGLKRTESLAALFSMTCLAFISIGLGIEAIRRIYGILYLPDEQEDVDGKLMSMIATIGVLVNVILAAVLGEHHTHLPGMDHDHSHDHHGGGDNEHGDERHHDHDHDKDDDDSHDHAHAHVHHDDDGHDHAHAHVHHDDDDSHDHDHAHDHHDEEDPHHHHDLVPLSPVVTKQQKKPQGNVNLRAAYLHVLADLTQSVAVLLAGLIIWWKPHWKIVDPIATILFCILVFLSTLGVIRASICVLLEEVPPDVSWQRVYDAMLKVPGIDDVHDLHIWSISQGVTALSVHVRTASATVDTKQVLCTLTKVCQANGIQHTTIQVQPFCELDNDCVTCHI